MKAAETAAEKTIEEPNLPMKMSLIFVNAMIITKEEKRYMNNSKIKLVSVLLRVSGMERLGKI